METLPQDNFTHDLHVGEQQNIPLNYLTATSIIGDKVYDENEQKVGDIKDIMINVHTGDIHYYVVEMGGFLGLGKKYFAVPFDYLKIDPDNKRFIFKQAKEVLSNAPGFNKWHWPNTNYHLVIVGGMYDNV
ncbi:PRC-barrel domain-containing protein [Ferruginibacter albus]|uniref:PRC-barrel domain-containing protein n=1 Tax=Ferruginibacter albus TaxID=2875540 RepID=UPI001CC7BB5D|nr:PRC-barrel domain-containing protein [Ferruginibacter albus]UAY53596.1 PRC-barrel domain-containing protein [Ferruginibacter albus]